MKIDSSNTNPTADGSSNGKLGNTPHPLDGVVAKPLSSSMFEIQTGMFNLAFNRKVQSGATESRPEDIRALEEHARAVARDICRDRYDPSQNPHDAMHQAEYERSLAQRKEAEKGEQYSTANLREAETKLALTPKAGPKPTINFVLVVAFVVAIALSVAPTLHDTIFQTLGDDLLVWFFSSLCGAFVGAMLTLAILGGRRTAWNWIGVGAGAVLGLGLGAVRLSSAEGAREVMFAMGLTIFEIAAVLLLELRGHVLCTREAAWLVRHAAEAEALSYREATQTDLTRWQDQIKELNDAITAKIAFIEDRHNRTIHIAEVEELLVKTVRDGDNAGNAVNIGRLRGVHRRRE